MSKYSTPDLSFNTDNFEFVYEPAEDTFLLLDALESEESEIKLINPSICLEIGSGSGCVSSFVASILGSTTFYLCTDINEKATDMTRKTGTHNGNQQLNSILTNLTDCLDIRLKHCVDLLIFNPPYVVTESLELKRSDALSKSWAGGIKGREVLDKFIPRVHNLLSANGLFYLLVLKENDPGDIAQIMSNYGFNYCVVLERRAGPEKLSILKFKRKDPFLC